jgi:hypothetical protein
MFVDVRIATARLNAQNIQNTSFFFFFVLNKNNYFLFGSVFIKKKIKLVFLKKIGSNRPVSVRFNYFGKKTGSNQFCSIFSGFGLFFRFSSIFLVSDL